MKALSISHSKRASDGCPWEQGAWQHQSMSVKTEALQFLKKVKKKKKREWLRLKMGGHAPSWSKETGPWGDRKWEIITPCFIKPSMWISFIYEKDPSREMILKHFLMKNLRGGSFLKSENILIFALTSKEKTHLLLSLFLWCNATQTSLFFVLLASHGTSRPEVTL